MKRRKKYRKRRRKNKKRIIIVDGVATTKTKKYKVKKSKELPYLIVLFSNRKRIKKISSSTKQSTIYEHWFNFKKCEKPPFTKEIGFNGKLTQQRIYELGLLFPKKETSELMFVKDSLGRNVETSMNNDKYYLKSIMPFWDEESIFDYSTRKKIYFNDLIEKIKPITEITQIFTLNIKLFVQVEDEILFYFGLKSTYDCRRLFDALREEIVNLGLGNFIFVKDVNTTQRLLLYDMLSKKGFERKKLLKYYSY